MRMRNTNTNCSVASNLKEKWFWTNSIIFFQILKVFVNIYSLLLPSKVSNTRPPHPFLSYLFSSTSEQKKNIILRLLHKNWNQVDICCRLNKTKTLFICKSSKIYDEVRKEKSLSFIRMNLSDLQQHSDAWISFPFNRTYTWESDL